MRKKIIGLSVIILSVFITIIFISVPKSIEYLKTGSSVIDFKSMNSPKPFPPEGLIVTNDYDWIDYGNQYLLGSKKGSDLGTKAILYISLPSSLDFGQTELESYYIRKIKKRGNELFVYIDLNDEPKVVPSSEARSLFQEMFFFEKNAIDKDTKVKIIKR